MSYVNHSTEANLASTTSLARHVELFLWLGLFTDFLGMVAVPTFRVQSPVGGLTSETIGEPLSSVS
jgi:hypothetical protein